MKRHITILGDVHGKYKRLHEIIREKERFPYIIQLGDFGFNYETLKNVDPVNFVIVGGNHENYNKIIEIPHYLGDYGYTNFHGLEFFFYRGAYSIDRQYRTIGIDWWPEEELKIDSFMKARDLYREKKPNIVITHDCPELLVLNYIGPYAKIYQSITGWALQELLNIHQPNLWIHGHYHVSKTTNYGKTTFVCLNELETYNIEV